MTNHRYPAASASPQITSPLRLNGQLDPEVGRWGWLFKWLLAIPHFVVLGFLWIVFVASTIAAGIAILFTGRYPRPIFDFNLGIMRWSWRVSFYSFSVLGTTKYPPFSLADDPAYPARLHVEYPERLSRTLVLIKWLLAIPHYLILALAPAAVWAISKDDAELFASADGLLGLAALCAAAALIFTSRYPRPVSTLVLGLNRWAFSIVAYVGLMTDSYPPFRLDSSPALTNTTTPEETATRVTDPPTPATPKPILTA